MVHAAAPATANRHAASAYGHQYAATYSNRNNCNPDCNRNRHCDGDPDAQAHCDGDAAPDRAADRDADQGLPLVELLVPVLG